MFFVYLAFPLAIFALVTAGRKSEDPTQKKLLYIASAVVGIIYFMVALANAP